MSLDKNALAAVLALHDAIALRLRPFMSEDEADDLADDLTKLPELRAALPTTSVSQPVSDGLVDGTIPTLPAAVLASAHNGLRAARPLIEALIADERNVVTWGLRGRLAAIDAALAAIENTPAADALEHRSLAEGWRSIETAPEDGTVILAARPISASGRDGE